MCRGTSGSVAAVSRTCRFLCFLLFFSFSGFFWAQNIPLQIRGDLLAELPLSLFFVGSGILHALLTRAGDVHQHVHSLSTCTLPRTFAIFLGALACFWTVAHDLLWGACGWPTRRMGGFHRSFSRMFTYSDSVTTLAGGTSVSLAVDYDTLQLPLLLFGFRCWSPRNGEFIDLCGRC